jgi:RNA polymerase sigma-70 factor (ECF subfamily)
VGTRGRGWRTSSSARRAKRRCGATSSGRDRELVRGALEEIAPEFREALVLRELEGLSYKEIAAITGAPIGTVMSRLARGREWLKRRLATPGRAAGR